MDKESRGFIKLDRSIFEHWIFQDAEKFRAFVDLIQLARWKDEKLLIGNELVTIPRGSYYTSELKLAERWGWSRNKTRDYLKLLEAEQMIIKKGTTKGTMLTIENYRVYQDEGTTKSTSNQQQKNNKKTSESTSKKHQKNNERYTKEEIKEIKRIDKKLEERKEVYQPPSLSFPTPLHEIIFNQFGDVTYKTWFENVSIEQTEDKVIMSTSDTFKKQIIEEKYLNHIKIFEGKEVQITLKEGDSN